MSRLDGVGKVVPSGVEELTAHPRDAVAVTTLTLALLAAGDWSIGIGVSPAGDAGAAATAAAGVLGKGGRAGTVRARIRTGDPGGKELSDDDREDLDEAAELESISRMPARVKCAELAWRTLDGIIEENKLQ